MVSNATVEFWMEGGPVLLEEGCWIKFGKVTTKGLSSQVWIPTRPHGQKIINNRPKGQ